MLTARCVNSAALGQARTTRGKRTVQQQIIQQQTIEGRETEIERMRAEMRALEKGKADYEIVAEQERKVWTSAGYIQPLQYYSVSLSDPAIFTLRIFDNGKVIYQEGPVAITAFTREVYWPGHGAQMALDIKAGYEVPVGVYKYEATAEPINKAIQIYKYGKFEVKTLAKVEPYTPLPEAPPLIEEPPLIEAEPLVLEEEKPDMKKLLTYGGIALAALSLLKQVV